VRKFPERCCNGGPNGKRWCGKQAAYIATDSFGMQWFCCAEHHEDALLIPIDAWFEEYGMPRESIDLEAAEREAAVLLEELGEYAEERS
jgi:hypothetical protein